MEKNRVFGGKCTELLGVYDLELSYWKTSQLSLFAEVSRSLDRLPNSGISVNGELYPLVNSEPHISEKDGFVLPTPTAQMRQSEERRKRVIKLAQEGKGMYTRHIKDGRERTYTILDSLIYRANLPTPTAHPPGKCEIDQSRIDPEKGINQRFYTKNGNHTQRGLQRLIDWGLLPTPTAHLSKETGCPSDYRRKTTSLIVQLLPEKDKNAIGKKRRLHPQFVEWMMGFPIGYTDLEP